jgi:hypothetical protein
VSPGSVDEGPSSVEDGLVAQHAVRQLRKPEGLWNDLLVFYRQKNWGALLPGIARFELAHNESYCSFLLVTRFSLFVFQRSVKVVSK